MPASSCSSPGQGDLNLLITMDGYDDWARYRSGNATSLSVTMNRRTLVLNVSLFDSNTLARGCRGNTVFNLCQFFPDRDFGPNGCSGIRGNLLTLYSLNITAPNYQPRSETIEVDANNQNVRYLDVIRKPGPPLSSRIRTARPRSAGASISVDSVLLGTTDTRGILIAPISRNTPITVEVEKDRLPDGKPGHSPSVQTEGC